MTFDYYAFLDKNEASKNPENATDLVDLGDRCLLRAWHDKKKDEARQDYMQQAVAQERKHSFLSDLHLEPDYTRAFLPEPDWFAIDVSFRLTSPWYSKDDRPLHVLDNPVRKDRVFGMPFMSATSWKGLLRWACRMQAGLSEHLEKHDMRMEGWQDPSWILHLFGNERGEDERFRSGALVCHPTWFDKVNFEVINPHDRARRAGTQPIYYEVVPAGTTGMLRLLYAPLPGEIERDQTTPDAFIQDLIDSIRALLENYGISAKRTAGWGKARIDLKKSKLLFLEGNPLDHFIPDATVPYEAPSEAFKKLMDDNGLPIKILFDEKEKLKFISKTQFKKLPEEKKPCKSSEFEDFKGWYEKHGEEYGQRLKANAGDTLSLKIKKRSLEDFIEAMAKTGNTRQGGNP